jgi:flagellar hook-associated protein 1 FlgK
MSDLFEVGRSSILTAQEQLEIVGNNIVNVHSEGYHRQVGEQVATVVSGSYTANNISPGLGVHLKELTSLYNKFAEQEQRYAQSVSKEVETALVYLNDLDHKFSSVGKKVPQSLAELYKGFDKLMDRPQDIATRESLLVHAQAVTENMNRFQDELYQMYQRVNNELFTVKDRINEITEDIHRIETSRRRSEGGNFDLLDERTQLLKELSEYIQVHINDSNSDNFNVMFAQGEVLVMNSKRFQLEIVPDSPLQQNNRLVLKEKGFSRALRQHELGGKVQAISVFRDDVLLPAIRHLDTMAVSLAASTNEIHAGGFDLDGNVADAFFKKVSRLGNTAHKFAPYPDNKGDAILSRIDILDDKALSSEIYTLKVESLPKFSPNGTSYEVRAGDEGEIRLLNKISKKTFVQKFPKVDLALGAVSLEAANDQYIFGGQGDSVEGFNIKIDDLMRLRKKDRFDIDPVFGASRHIDVYTKNATQIAAARGPEIETSRDAMRIEVLEVDRQNADFQKFMKFGNNLSLEFDQATAGKKHQLTVSIQDVEGLDVPFDANVKPPIRHAKVILQPNPSITGDDLELPQEVALYGIKLRISESLQQGDSIKINLDFGVGDNLNAVKLENLRTHKVMAGETQTILGSYTRKTMLVGSVVSAYKIREESASAALNLAVQRVQNESGVVLDEEAADMVKFQQIYQASAQVLNTAGVVMDTVLNLR